MFDEGMMRFAGVMIILTLTGGGIYALIILLNAMQKKLGVDSQSEAITSDRLQELLGISMDDLDGTDPSLVSATEMKALRERVESLEDLVADLGESRVELEERLDFAERLLSREENRAVLPEPTTETSAEVSMPVSRERG